MKNHTSPYIPADQILASDINSLFSSLAIVGLGNGADGSATLDGTATVSWASKVSSTYTLTQDVNLIDLTINSGVILEQAGYAIYGLGTLTNNGTIRNNGTNGGNGGNASGTGGGTAGTAGIGGIGHTFTAGTDGKAGGTGGNSGGAYSDGNAGTAGTAGTAKTSLGSNGVGGGGGGGGGNGDIQVGGTGGA